MKRTSTSFWIVMAISVALAACGTTPAPAFKGRWQPVNHFAATTQAIPLDHSYVFYPSPMDGTLKRMLDRWAQDSDLTLSYQHTVDFTLHKQVAQIRTGNLQQALALLKDAYAAQRLEFAAAHGQIVVRRMQDAVAATPSNERRPSAAP